MKRSIALIAIAGLGVVAAGCGGDTDQPAGQAKAAAPASPTVQIKTFIFSPKPLTVKAGTTVKFENLDGTIHTVTSGTREKPTPKLFDSKLAKSSGTFEHTFDKAGTYAYFCSLHSGNGMTGEIVVQ